MSTPTTPELVTSQPATPEFSKPCYNSSTAKVEIFAGSGVFMDELSWAMVNKCSSSSSFIRSLTLALFDVETLVRSNLRGGASKRKSDDEKREALDPQKLNALYGASLKKFPNLTKSQIGSTINGKIAELRFNLKKKSVN
ncbi:UNVERIFIED_CONTAM: hypothetical protein FKN15_018709 [Acipenser sinensis]